MTYDSKQDTLEHIMNVQNLIIEVGLNLDRRMMAHDATKLRSPEKEMYDEMTPKLRDLTYGSEEYRATLRAMGPALKHHYENNSHHPEHFQNGINGMSLLDVIEMLVDWKAAGMRHADGDFSKSMEINRKRFNISDQLFEILVNTAKELGWISQ